MKKKRLILVLVLAIGSGTLAAYLALDFLRQQTVVPLVAAEPRRSQVAVAARDLPLGSVLRTEDIRLVSWPADALPLGYATSTAELVGRGLITPVRANEPLLSSKLADRESGGGMPILIPEGMRALSVRVDEVVGVAGFVLPGTRVDVLVTVDDRNGGNRENTISRVVLQNIAVLASGQTVQRDVEGKPQTVSVVTLMVNPDDAEVLTLAANEGKIQLALRNMLDLAEVRTRGARVPNLVNPGGQPANTPVRTVRVPARSAPDRQATVVETYRGGQRTIQTF